MRVIVYTAILGDFDSLKEPRVRDAAIRYVCFTDQRPSEANGWEIRLVERTGEHARLQQRSFKILSHRFFHEANAVTLYIDANLELVADPRQLAGKYLTSSDLALFRHPQRDGIYAELDACAELAKDDPATLARAAARYRARRVPETGFLHAGGFLLRRHTQRIVDFNEDWYGELLQSTFRDQPSLAYTLWRTEMRPETIDKDIWRNDVFNFHPHKHVAALSSTDPV